MTKITTGKKYKYSQATKTISFKVAEWIPELGTDIRDKLYRCFEKLSQDEDLTQVELDWCNGVLEP